MSKVQFMAYLPDKPNAESLRASVRDKHLSNIKVLLDNGTIKCGNALVHPDTLSKPLEEQSLVGSMMILEANSYQDALGLLKQDIYYTTGVWDADKIVVLPFRGKPVFNATDM